MKRIMILLAVACTFSVQAQQNEFKNFFGFSWGYGLNSMSYTPLSGEHKMGMGFDAGVHYAIFFDSQRGLRVGLYFSTASATARYNTQDVTRGLHHADNPGVLYDLYTSFNEWKERQSLGFISVPLEFLWRIPLNDKWILLSGIGARFDFNVNGTYSADEGSFSTSGYFPSIGSRVSNHPNHGFINQDANFESDIESLPMAVNLQADLGVRMQMDNLWGLYLGLYGSYGLNNMVPESDTPMLCVNAGNASQIDYRGTFASNEISSMHLVSVGVKMGLDFDWNANNKKDTRPVPKVELPPVDMGLVAKSEEEEKKKQNEQDLKEKLNFVNSKIQEVETEIIKLEGGINKFKKAAEWVDKLQYFYDTVSIDYLYYNFNQRELEFHEAILSNLSKKVEKIDHVKTLLNYRGKLEYPYDETTNEEDYQNLKELSELSVYDSRARDTLKDWIFTYGDINDSVNQWMRGDRSFRSYVKLLQNIFNTYEGIDLNKAYPYLAKKAKEAIRRKETEDK